MAECEGGGNYAMVLPRDFQVQLHFLKRQDSEVAPAGDSHRFHERGFSGVARLPLLGERGQKVLETLSGFAFEDDGVCK